MMLVVLILFMALTAYLILTYNRLITQIEAVHNNQKQIDAQLDKRYKIFESLLSTVQKNMDYERTTLNDVIALRAQSEAAKNNGDEKARMMFENQISDIATHLNVVFEQYPLLKTDEFCLKIQADILSTENKLAYAKQSYNDSIEFYQSIKQSFPASMMISSFRRKLDVGFSAWQFNEPKMTEQAAYTVQL